MYFCGPPIGARNPSASGLTERRSSQPPLWCTSLRVFASIVSVHEIAHVMGIDRPWYAQYAHFVARLASGNLGYSLQRRQHRSIAPQD